MLKFIISSLIVFTSLTCTSQIKTLEPKDDTIKKDSIKTFYNPKTYGLRIGADLTKPAISFIEDDYNGLEIVTDWRINTRLFAAGEIGYTKNTNNEDYFTHTARGTYLKVGINYNLYTNWLEMDNETFLGMRYGTSFFNNEINQYEIAQYGDYFDPKKTTGTKYTNLNSHWLEVVAGLKVETFKNLFLGFMISVSKLITTNHPNNFKNTYSPGMGEISKNGTGANFNYTISYRIPLYKK